MKIALAIPTSARWVPARRESLARLLESLRLGTPDEMDLSGPRIEHAALDLMARFFMDRAKNTVWSVDMWRWLADQEGDWCLQIQDDVLVSPAFWGSLLAMLSALPKEASVVSLASVHPMTPEVARKGHRWHRTTGNLVGWAYALRGEAMTEFLVDRERLGDNFREQNEDMQLSIWAEHSKRTVWCPVPTIADHDTTIASSYANDHHAHRRPKVTWRDFPEASLQTRDFWLPSGTPELLPMPVQRVCWYCGVQETYARSDDTGAEICKGCIAALSGSGGKCGFCLKEPAILSSPTTGALVGRACLAQLVGTVVTTFVAPASAVTPAPPPTLAASPAAPLAAPVEK